jgi:hypothetical protein
VVCAIEKLAGEDYLYLRDGVWEENIYNKALDDSHVWFKRYMDNMEAEYYVIYK